MKVKKIALTVACATLLSSQVGMASQSVNGLSSISAMDESKTIGIESPFANQDLSYAFNLKEGTVFDMASLSDMEMDETEGAVWWYWVAAIVATTLAVNTAGNQPYAPHDVDRAKSATTAIYNVDFNNLYSGMNWNWMNANYRWY